MAPKHQAWNKQQHLLQTALAQPEKHPEWRELFFSQHAQVHSSRISKDRPWSFEDEILNGMDDGTLRVIPPKAEHSIAWILWHLARCEDLTMNMLVADLEQVLEREGWKRKLHSPIIHTGNAIDRQAIILFSDTVDLDSLKAYRLAVGEATRLVVRRLEPEDLGQKVESARIQWVRQTGAVLPAAEAIINYWSKRTIAGLLLMPPTRHCFIHLNEALRIKSYLRVSR